VRGYRSNLRPASARAEMTAESGIAASGSQWPLWKDRHNGPGKSGTTESHRLRRWG